MMNVAADVTFYSRVVKVTNDYLGPAADRFVARQIRNHLGKEPEHLEQHELADLITWFSMAMILASASARLCGDKPGLSLKHFDKQTIETT